MTAGLVALALLLLAGPAGAGDRPRLLPGGLVDAEGRRLGVIRESPYGGVDVYDPRTGQPLYEVRPPRPGGQP